MATRYRQVFNEMVEQNKELFDAFQELHDKYALDQPRWQEEFNDKGKIVMDTIKQYEDRLCGHSERSGYSSFTAGLAEKFQAEVRKNFPKVDYIGVKIKKAPDTGFSLKKITLR